MSSKRKFCKFKYFNVQRKRFLKKIIKLSMTNVDTYSMLANLRNLLLCMIMLALQLFSLELILLVLEVISLVLLIFPSAININLVLLIFLSTINISLVLFIFSSAINISVGREYYKNRENLF